MPSISTIIGLLPKASHLLTKIIKLVLDILSESLFALSQLHKCTSSLLTISIRLLKLLSDRKILVSSAKSINYNNLEQLDMSLIYSKNSNEPNIVPCGTPHVIRFLVEFILSRLTYWVLDVN